MKKFVAILLAACMVLALAACGTKTETPATSAAASASAAGKTIYVLGPTPDHGWTAQSGVYAEKACADIKAAGKYNAVYMAASSGEEQVDLVNTIIANGDAAGVVFMPLEDSAKAGQEALIAAKIPFISYDRIIEGPDKSAILNASGDNWQCGAAVAYWLQKNGMVPGDTLVVLRGDNSTACDRRQEGFEQFLRGEINYKDGENKTEYKTTSVWTQADLDKTWGQYEVVCNWSADGAYEYLEQKLPDIVAKAKAGSGRLFIYSQDDEMTFGVLNLLEANAIDEQTKTDLANLNVYISAIGGMEELYAVMRGTDAQSATAQKYFDGLMSVYFSPYMFYNVIFYMVDYLDGNWSYSVGDGKYEPVWIVDKNNVANYTGFAGH